MSAEVFVSDATWPRESGSKRPVRDLRPWRGTLWHSHCAATSDSPRAADEGKRTALASVRTRGCLRAAAVWLYNGRKVQPDLPGVGQRVTGASSASPRRTQTWPCSKPPATPTVLVQYDAFSEKHSTVERRAYYLYPNQARVDAGTRPELVKPSVADGMKPIPVLPTQGALTNQPPDSPRIRCRHQRGAWIHLVSADGA